MLFLLAWLAVAASAALSGAVFGAVVHGLTPDGSNKNAKIFGACLGGFLGIIVGEVLVLSGCITLAFVLALATPVLLPALVLIGMGAWKLGVFSACWLGSALDRLSTLVASVRAAYKNRNSEKE